LDNLKLDDSCISNPKYQIELPEPEARVHFVA